MEAAPCQCGHRPEVNDEDCHACGRLLDLAGRSARLISGPSLRYRRSFAALKDAPLPEGFVMAPPPAAGVRIRHLRAEWNPAVGPELALLLGVGEAAGGGDPRDDVARRIAEEDEVYARRLQEEEDRKEQRRKKRLERDSQRLAEMLTREEQQQLQDDEEMARRMGGCEGRCRFCQSLCVVEDPDLAPVCAYTEECKAKRELFCPYVVECRGEDGSAVHHPCSATQDCAGNHYCEKCEADACPICGDGFDQDPALRLASCAHVIHVDCVKDMLQHGVKEQGPGMKIGLSSFGCALCRVPIESAALEEELKEPLKTTEEVVSRGIERAEREKDAEVLRLRNGEKLALLRRITATYAFYRCKTCTEIFCGGRQACEAGDDPEAQGADAQCPQCTFRESGGGKPCDRHAQEELMIKCDFCCGVAQFHCWGTTYFCNPCHNPPINRNPKPCIPEQCPLQGKHPASPTKGYIYGCQKCYAEQQ